jgi:dihydrofolate reductase
MTKIVLNIAMSLDGYIATLDHSVDFLNTGGKEIKEAFEEFLNGVDSIVMGSTSYDKMLELGGNTFQDKTIYVLTTQEYADEENVIFLDKEIEEVLFELKALDNKTVWLFGGAKTVKQFIEQDAIDTYHITIAPTILGTGIPLFLFTKEEKELHLENTVSDGEFITLTYTRKKKQ